MTARGKSVAICIAGIVITIVGMAMASVEVQLTEGWLVEMRHRFHGVPVGHVLAGVGVAVLAMGMFAWAFQNMRKGR